MIEETLTMAFRENRRAIALSRTIALRHVATVELTRLAEAKQLISDFHRASPLGGKAITFKVSVD